MRKLIFTLLLILSCEPGWAAIECKNKSWYPDLPQMIEKMTKKKVESLGTASKKEILGNWFEMPKGSKWREEAKPYLVVLADGTLKRGGVLFDYEILADKIIYKVRKSANAQVISMPYDDTCYAIFKVGDSFYLPSRESLITPLFR